MTTQQQNSSGNSATTANQAGNQTQYSQTAPWLPTQQSLQTILGGINGTNTQPTAAQAAALSQLQGQANNIPNYGPTAANTANAFLTGDPTGLLYPGNQQLQNTLSPIANQPLNPLQSPIVSDLLQNIQQRVLTGANSNAAAAGRSLNSGDNAGAIAFGTNSAALPLLLGQYNTNQQNVINAGSQMFGANYQTAGAGANNVTQGLNVASNLPSYYTAPALAQLSAANTAFSQPFQNVGAAENLTIPIAGLGGTSYGTGTSNQNTNANTNVAQQTTLTPSLLQDFAMLGGGLNSIFGGANPAATNLLGGLKGLGSGLLSAFG